MNYDFRIDILRDYIKIGEAKTESVSIKYDYNSGVMKGIKLDMKRADMTTIVNAYDDGNGGITFQETQYQFDMFKDRIRPVLIRDGVETSLGIYMIIANPQTLSDLTDYYSIEGYDETMIIKQACFEDREYYAAGTAYLTIVQQLLTSLGFANVIADASSATLAEDLEVDPGTNMLEFVNQMLDAINYQHVYQDASGAINLRKFINPTEPEFVYRDSGRFSIIPPITRTTDIYDLPNVVVGVWSSPDSDTPIVYKKVNDDPMSLISTVNRGYKVVKKIYMHSIASQNEMEAYVEKTAFNAMQMTETISFDTPIEGGHEPNTAIQIDTADVKGLFIETGWNIQASSRAFTMNHKVERKVFV